MPQSVGGATGRILTDIAASEPHFAYRIDRWDPSGNVVQRVADVDDLAVALATYQAACKRWPGNCFTLRQGPRVIADSRQTQPAKK